MQARRFNVVTDGAWGSCGKGAITTALANKYRPEIISTTNMANAGHTAVNTDGTKYVAKALPSAAILHQWLNNYKPYIAIGSSAAFDISQFMNEIEICGINDYTLVHKRAGVITPEHKQRENVGPDSTKHIASTMQGCGAFLSDKVLRLSNLKLARDYQELTPYTMNNFLSKLCEHNGKISVTTQQSSNEAMLLNNLLVKDGFTILHEGSQGYSLDINHGSHYPQCTSRSTTAIQNLVDMGLSPRLLGDIYLVIRPYPIRVGNVYENNIEMGNSGGCYHDHYEITWEEVARQSGAPMDIMKNELTTVTKRMRRVFTFSETQLLEAVTINGATRIALNFANYVDWTAYGCSDYDELPPKVHDFIEYIEHIAKIPVTIIGTGPQLNHVCFREECLYGLNSGH